nr:MAG TPA: hypothetical protein [Caudoviricetes sp.]
MHLLHLLDDIIPQSVYFVNKKRKFFEIRC